MLKSRRNEALVALVLVAPFVAIYGWLFIYPTIQMVRLSFTNAPLIGAGEWTGIENYKRLFSDRVFQTAIFNTAYFVVPDGGPRHRRRPRHRAHGQPAQGWTQSLVLAAFFLPFILPVTVVYLIWWWMTDYQFGILQYIIAPIVGDPVNVFRRAPWFLPMTALVTVWWTNGFSILLFLAGLRNISPEVQEAAELDGATRWQRFPPCHLASDLAGDRPLPDHPVDPAARDLRPGLSVLDRRRRNQTMVLVQYIPAGLRSQQGGYGATVAVALFLIIVCFSVLQFQALKARRTSVTTTAPTAAPRRNAGAEQPAEHLQCRWSRPDPDHGDRRHHLGLSALLAGHHHAQAGGRGRPGPMSSPGRTPSRSLRCPHHHKHAARPVGTSTRW